MKKLSYTHHPYEFDVVDESGAIIGTVNRQWEFAEPDSEVKVTLWCGHVERFWLPNLTNEEYVKRALYLRDNV